MAIRGRSQPFRPNRSQTSVWYVSQTIATADVSSGTGDALTPNAQLTVYAGMAQGAGGTADVIVTIVPRPPVAFGSALTLDPGILFVVNSGFADGSGVAFDPELFGTNGVVHPGLASGLGFSPNPTIYLLTDDGSHGDGYPWLTVNAGVALGGGGALNPETSGTNTIAFAGIATGSGSVLTPAISIIAQLDFAIGSGAALNPTVTAVSHVAVAVAGIALGGGGALTPTVTTISHIIVHAGVARGIGRAFSISGPTELIIPTSISHIQPLFAIVVTDGRTYTVVQHSGVTDFEVNAG